MQLNCTATEIVVRNTATQFLWLAISLQTIRILFLREHTVHPLEKAIIYFK
jgi:hypothetical protein